MTTIGAELFNKLFSQSRQWEFFITKYMNMLFEKVVLENQIKH